MTGELTHRPSASDASWLGDIPEGWKVRKFRYVFEESPEKIEAEVVGPMLSVSGYRGVEVKEYDDENRRRSDEDLVGYRIVRPGQLVVNTMWLNYSGLGVSEFEGHVSPAYRSYNINVAVDRGYIHHLMRSSIYVQAYTRLLTGIRPNSLQMSREDLMDFPILLPPPSQQTAISAFLDRETGKIDALVEEQRRLIELLKEKRQAVISHAVTKGLDPNAKMKPSGVEWLGDVPEHWEVRKFTHVIDAQEGPGILAVDFRDDGVPLMRVAGAQKRWATLDGCNWLDPAKVQQRWSHFVLELGDLVISASASMGTVAEVGPEAVGAIPYTGLIRLKPRRNQVTRDYVRAIVASSLFHTQIDLLKAGATIQHYGPTHLAQMIVTVPPIEEQQEIAAFVDQRLQLFDQLVAETDAAINLLQERRAAFISAAVTGKVDVRDFVEIETTRRRAAASL